MALTSVRKCGSSHERRELTIAQQWKVFNFFDVSEVKPPDGESSSIFDVSQLPTYILGFNADVARAMIFTASALGPTTFLLAAAMAMSASSPRPSRSYERSKPTTLGLSHK